MWALRVALLLSLNLFILSTLASSASAHYISGDSVDNGEIRFNDQTQWDDARVWAKDRWNDLAGGVLVAPDTATTLAS